jgi:iron-sulfur cluster assembly accessory protein
VIQLSENAAKAVQKIKADQGKPEAVLRVSVRGGGCSGLTYDVQLDDKQSELDRVFEFGPVKVVCDSKSLIYLDGMTIDFSSELVGGGFRFVNPNATGTCGCGTSFAV